MSDIILSDKEKKLFSYIKNSEIDVTVKVIEEKLGSVYVGALGKLVNLGLIKSEKRNLQAMDNSNPYSRKWTKCFFVKAENCEKITDCTITLNREEFEEELEDEMNIGESIEGVLFPYVNNELKFIDMFEKYLEIICNGSPMKVKISAIKGKIVIEKMEE